MAAELAERRGLTLEHAHGWLKHVGLELPMHEIEGDEAILTEARNVLDEGVRRIGDQVRNSMDFHSMQQGAAPVERAMLTGTAVSIPGFTDRLAEKLSLPLETGLASEGRAGGLDGIDASSLAVAAGLTIDEAVA